MVPMVSDLETFHCTHILLILMNVQHSLFFTAEQHLLLIHQRGIVMIGFWIHEIDKKSFKKYASSLGPKSLLERRGFAKKMMKSNIGEGF